MHPYTETWKPAWRALHRIVCVLAACMTCLMLIIQLGWMHGAFVYPHRLLKLSLGDSHWMAITTEFYDGMTFRGGSRAWNLRLTVSDAESLRAKCKEGAGFRSIESMRKPVKWVIAPQETESAVGQTTMGRWLEAEKRLPQGCLLGWEETLNKASGSQAVLFERVIQIEEWVD